MPQRQKKIFVSYVRENTEEIDRICKRFKIEGIDYWLDRDQIEPGKIWKQAIKDAINDGAFFLACFSKEFVAKNQSYMNKELLLAVDILTTKPYDSGWLIPIKLSPCEIPDIDIGGNKTLRDIQYLNFHEDWNKETERLIDIIKREESPKQSVPYDKYLEMEFTYLGLKSLIENGNGVGFHNADLGHPVYVIGASEDSEEAIQGWSYADSPKKNPLFKMLSKLSKELKKDGIEASNFTWWYDFSEWQNFCKFVIGVYEQKTGK